MHHTAAGCSCPLKLPCCVLPLIFWTVPSLFLFAGLRPWVFLGSPLPSLAPPFFPASTATASLKLKSTYPNPYLLNFLASPLLAVARKTKHKTSHNNVRPLSSPHRALEVETKHFLRSKHRAIVRLLREAVPTPQKAEIPPKKRLQPLLIRHHVVACRTSALVCCLTGHLFGVFPAALLHFLCCQAAERLSISTTSVQADITPE